MMDYMRSLDFVHYLLYGLAIASTLGVGISRYLHLPKAHKFREYSEAAFFAIWVALSVRATVAEAQSIPSESMVPTFLIGDNLLVTKYNWGYHLPGTHGRVFDFGKPRRGEIVTFLPPLEASKRKNYVKRCVGIPGDTIEVKGKIVYINGEIKDYAQAIGEMDLGKIPDSVKRKFTLEKQNELENPVSFIVNIFDGPGKTWYGPYKEGAVTYWLNHTVSHLRAYRRIIDPGHELELYNFLPKRNQIEIWNAQGNRDWYGPYTLKENEYWMMGDNRDNSADSRYFGPVAYIDIKGHPTFRYFPFIDRFGSVE